MAVGDNTGNTYRGQQGTGFATVIGYNPQVDLAIADQKFRKEQAAAAEKKAKEVKLMNAYEQLGKIKPDNWYVHDEYMDNMMTGLLDLGASYIAKGIDPMTDPAAKDFQKLMIETSRTTEYSKQFKAQFEDIQKAYKNGEDLENWDEISLYLHNPDLPGMVNGDYGKMPTPIFKKPEVSTFLALNEYADKWRVNNKERVPSAKDFILLATELISDPTKAGGFASTNSKFQQRYSGMTNEQKEALSARGAKNGGVDGYTQYVAEQFKALMDPNFNLGEEVMALAKKEGLSDSTKESGDTTRFDRYSKMTDSDIKKVLRPILQDGAVQREVDRGLYGDPDKDISYNIKAAEQYYIPIYRKNRETQHSTTTDEGSKEGKKAAASFTDWYDDITSGDGDKFVAAAPYLNKEALARFVPNMPKDATIGNVKYYRSGRMEIDVIDNDGYPVFTKELKVTDIPKEMLKNAYMDQYKGTKRNYETTETGGTLNAPPVSRTTNSTGLLNSPPK